MGRWITLLGILFLLSASPALAQGSGTEAPASPRSPWGDFTVVEEESPRAWWEHALLWFPNRAMDFIDIFRVDVGVGPAYGGVLRLTEHGQMGYREMNPGSMRIGAFGRKAPYLIESSNEFGIGPGYVNSKDREVCKGEIGLGLDVVVVGAYAGICVEEVVDFVAGIFFLDLMGDDYR